MLGKVLDSYTHRCRAPRRKKLIKKATETDNLKTIRKSSHKIVNTVKRNLFGTKYTDPARVMVLKSSLKTLPNDVYVYFKDIDLEGVEFINFSSTVHKNEDIELAFRLSPESVEYKRSVDCKDIKCQDEKVVAKFTTKKSMFHEYGE